MKTIETPSSKKDLSSGGIILLTLAEKVKNQGGDFKAIQ